MYEPENLPKLLPWLAIAAIAGIVTGVFLGTKLPTAAVLVLSAACVAIIAAMLVGKVWRRW